MVFSNLRWCFYKSSIVSQSRCTDADVGVTRHHFLTTDSNSVIAMTTYEQDLQWIANIMLSSSHKLTKSIQTTLKTTALGLGGLEDALSGSMHSDQKFKLLRDKLLLQANDIKVLNTFVKVHTITCEILPSNIFCSSVESIESTSFP